MGNADDDAGSLVQRTMFEVRFLQKNSFQNNNKIKHSFIFIASMTIRRCHASCASRPDTLATADGEPEMMF